MLHLTSVFKTTIPIDGEEIRTNIKRLTDAEYLAFSTAWNRNKRRGERPVDRRPGEDDLSVDQVRAKRDADMSVDELKAHREREDFHAKESAQFTIDTITNYVSVEPGQITDDDHPVTTGAQLVEAFATRDNIMGAFVAAVFIENTFSAVDKKKLRSLSGSARSSNASTATTDGERPAPTADAVDPQAIAKNEGVTDVSETMSSGMTAPSS